MYQKIYHSNFFSWQKTFSLKIRFFFKNSHSSVPLPFLTVNQPKSQFYSHQKVKNDKRKDSNFNGPIMPSHFPNNIIPQGGIPQDPRFHHHFQHNNDVSTRPNSNISIHCPTDDDIPNKKKNKKKKKKPASVQNKQEEHLKDNNFMVGPSKINPF